MPRKKMTKKEIEYRQLNTVARIAYRRGKPFVNLITGREPHPTGRMVCIKAGMKALGWESIKAERPMIELCEVASPVHHIMTQPHNLIMKVSGERYPWRYRPDLELEVDVRFADDLKSGAPFAEAVATWRPNGKPARTITMIVEVKDDADSRLGDPRYEQKLEFAREIYESINWRFITVVRSRDIEAPNMFRSVRSIYLDHTAALTPKHVSDVTDLLAARKGRSDLGSVVTVLGGGVKARVLASALHARRFISLDLTNDLKPDTPVFLVNDGKAIFELPGAHPW